MLSVAPRITPSEIDPAEARRLIDAGEAILVDVREADEHRRVHIAGSILVPLGSFDADRIAAAARGRRILVHCKSGRRSADAVARLQSMAGCEAESVVGGIEAWAAAGMPVVRDKRAPMPIMQQVQLTIGLFVAVFTGLGALTNPWFLVVPAFMGCGLVFAGLTGFCGLATLLSRMPWNRMPSLPAVVRSSPDSS